MTVELKYCESCSVIIPVDPEAPGPGGNLCDNCRTSSGSATTEAVLAEASPSAGAPPSLAATQPVARPSRSPALRRELPRPAAHGQHTPSRLGDILMAAALLLPILIGAPVLVSAARGPDFALPDETRASIRRFGQDAARGARLFQEMVIGIRPGSESIEEPAPPRGAAEGEPSPR